MWTQRDQLQAYQFLRRRIVSALQFGDANEPASPSRRLIIAGIVGMALALVIAAGVGIYGVLRPGHSADWRTAGQILLVEDGGELFVLGTDDRLHPVANYASARLLTGPDAPTVRIAADRLRDAPRGRGVGIPGAPETLPEPDRLVRGPWSVCAAGTATRTLIGVRAPGAALGERALIVSGENGDRFAVIDGRRLALPDDRAAVALGYSDVPELEVAVAWLDAVPAGPDLGLLAAPESTEPGPELGDRRTRVGDVLAAEDATGGGTRFYLVEASDRLRAIGRTEATLLLANPDNSGREATPVSAAAIAGLGSAVRGSVEGSGFPDEIPPPVSVSADDVACATTGDEVRLADAERFADVPALELDNPKVSDATVAIGTGAGALVSARQVFDDPAAGFTRDPIDDLGSGELAFVSDQGIRYPLPNLDAAAALGYADVQPVAVSTMTLALLPTGPELDPDAAATTLTAVAR